MLMEVLQGEKKKRVKKNSESFYEYRNSFTIGFLRVSLTLLDNEKLLRILTLSLHVAISITTLPSLHTLPQTHAHMCITFCILHITQYFHSITFPL